MLQGVEFEPANLSLLKGASARAIVFFFVLCGDGLRWFFPIPCFGCGTVWFFGLGCFVVAVGMGEVEFCLVG